VEVKIRDIEAEWVRQVAAEFGESVVLNEYPADDRATLLYLALFTSHTPSKIIPPPTRDTGTIGSPKTAAATTTVTTGSRYRSAPT
jgi:hypothetical protein